MTLLHRLLSAYRASFSGLPRTVWLLAGSMLVNRMGSMVLPFLALYLTSRRGFDVAAAGTVMGVYGAGALAGSWLGGQAADRFGSVRTQIASFALTGAGYLVFSTLREPVAITVAAFLLALLAESFRPALFAAVAGYAPPEVRARSLALIRAAHNLGMTIGPAIGGVLASVGYGWLFAVDAFTCWAAAIVVTVFLGRAPRPAGEGTPVDRSASPWRDPPFLAFLGLVVVLAMVFFQLLSTWPLHLRLNVGVGEAGIGGLFALSAGLVALFELPLLRAVERLPALRTAAIGSVLVGGGFALLGLPGGVGLAVASTIVWTAGEMLAFPLTNAAVADRAPEGARGAYMGAYAVAFSTAFVAGPALGTWTLDRVGPITLWAATGVAGLLVAAGFLAVARPFAAPRG